jgi:putative membrane protein
MSQHHPHLGKGVLAGLVGGLIGTIVMTEFQNGWNKASQSMKNGNAQKNDQDQQKQKEPEKEHATMIAAGKIARLTGHQLSREQRKEFGPVVHYSFGALQDAIYGTVTEITGNSRFFLPGWLFGSALFLAADEIAMPALGFSGTPTECPLSSHLYGLASHLVYGISTEIARRGVRAAL